MARFTASIFLAQQSRAILGMAPTKLAELLASGVPCLTNEGLGDCPEILKNQKIGIVIKDARIESLEEGVRSLFTLSRQPGISEKCISAAHTLFDIDRGVTAYNQIYVEIYQNLRNRPSPLMPSITS